MQHLGACCAPKVESEALGAQYDLLCDLVGLFGHPEICSESARPEWLGADGVVAWDAAVAALEARLPLPPYELAWAAGELVADGPLAVAAEAEAVRRLVALCDNPCPPRQ